MKISNLIANVLCTEFAEIPQRQIKLFDSNFMDFKALQCANAILIRDTCLNVIKIDICMLATARVFQLG